MSKTYTKIKNKNPRMNNKNFRKRGPEGPAPISLWSEYSSSSWFQSKNIYIFCYSFPNIYHFILEIPNPPRAFIIKRRNKLLVFRNNAVTKVFWQIFELLYQHFQNKMIFNILNPPKINFCYIHISKKIIKVKMSQNTFVKALIPEQNERGGVAIAIATRSSNFK